MTIAQVALALLLVPALLLGLLVRRSGRTSLGVDPRAGAGGELLRGAAFAVPFLVALAVLGPLTGLYRTSPAEPDVAEMVGVGILLAVVFGVEELILRGLLMSGLGLLIGRVAALLVTAVLAAAPYAMKDSISLVGIAGLLLGALLPGWARWRSGRIWWGLGQRWAWTVGFLALGFSDLGFAVRLPFFTQEQAGPRWLTGGDPGSERGIGVDLGLECGLFGVAFLLTMILMVPRFAQGRRGP